MDISLLSDQSETVEKELLHPATEKGLNIFVTIRSSSSDFVKDVNRSFAQENVGRMEKRKSLKVEKIESQNIATCAACIVSWRWENSDLELAGDKNPECNEKNKKLLVSNDPFYDQITEWADNFADFMKKPQTP